MMFLTWACVATVAALFGICIFAAIKASGAESRLEETRSGAPEGAYPIFLDADHGD